MVTRGGDKESAAAPIPRRYRNAAVNREECIVNKFESDCCYDGMKKRKMIKTPSIWEEIGYL